MLIIGVILYPSDVNKIGIRVPNMYTQLLSIRIFYNKQAAFVGKLVLIGMNFPKRNSQHDVVHMPVYVISPKMIGQILFQRAQSIMFIQTSDEKLQVTYKMKIKTISKEISKIAGTH